MTVADRPAADSRLYYGYWLIAASFVAQFVAVGVTNYVAGPFLTPMTEDLGWTRCGSCGLEHARTSCPTCSAGPASLAPVRPGLARLSGLGEVRQRLLATLVAGEETL